MVLKVPMAACLTSDDLQGLAEDDPLRFAEGEHDAKERLYCVVLQELLRFRESGQSSRVHTRYFPGPSPVGALGFTDAELDELEGTGMHDKVAAWRENVAEAYGRLVQSDPSLKVRR
jgi:hypothetical protein